jgi:hypothetical protein
VWARDYVEEKGGYLDAFCASLSSNYIGYTLAMQAIYMYLLSS